MSEQEIVFEFEEAEKDQDYEDYDDVEIPKDFWVTDSSN